MKDHTEQEGTTLRAEVAALRQQVQALAVRHANAAKRTRWRVSKRMRFVLLPLFVLLTAGGVLYGQGAMDALFIDQSGKVGIGTTTPNATLDVAGTVNVTQKASLADTTIKGSLTTEGNVGIGTPAPSAKLEVNLSNAKGWDGNLKGLRLLAPDNNYYLDVNTYVVASGNVGYQLSPSFSTTANTGLVITTPGNVGIGTQKPTAKLEVKGDTLLDGNLTVSKGLSVASGQDVSGIPVVDFQSQVQNFKNQTDSTKTLSYTFTFGRPVDKAEPMLKSWSLSFDKGDRPFQQAAVHCGDATITGDQRNIVTVQVTFALKDNSGVFDDPYSGEAKGSGSRAVKTDYVNVVEQGVPDSGFIRRVGKTAPDGWLFCDSGAIPGEEKYKVKDLLGKPTTPDLRGRTLIGAGQGGGLTSRSLGDQGGEETHTLTINEMPKHNHHGFGEAYADWPFGQVGRNQRGSKGGADNDNYYYNTSSTGGHVPFTNMQPYFTVKQIGKNSAV